MRLLLQHGRHPALVGPLLPPGAAKDVARTVRAAGGPPQEYFAANAKIFYLKWHNPLKMVMETSVYNRPRRFSGQFIA
ncbi:MAG: hypothetical protein A3E78_04605 [Alphaproteobacteria bacterium RIFCSPHIGHO2_12_FULL_63_12]|nr:MAG: hypothetical protein A3E78_04605 [Alphaproteobacteria bacterium RIFCSPHIGHO2_12_FULL_63_12]